MGATEDKRSPSLLWATPWQLIQDAGSQLLYLPAYFPDLNKISRCWSWLKF
ncbi:MAG: transposase [Brasilonema angustatum HA4187-MV1]|nr:transposase [Brasilonema angustatum HA4187-MV1]